MTITKQSNLTNPAYAVTGSRGGGTRNFIWIINVLKSPIFKFSSLILKREQKQLMEKSKVIKSLPDLFTKFRQLKRNGKCRSSIYDLSFSIPFLMDLPTFFEVGSSAYLFWPLESGLVQHKELLYKRVSEYIELEILPKLAKLYIFPNIKYFQLIITMTSGKILISFPKYIDFMK